MPNLSFVASLGLVASIVVGGGVPAPGQGPWLPFSAPVVGANPSLTGGAQAFAVGDFNGDGRDDIISGTSPVFAWILALPNGDYGPRNTFTLAPTASGTALDAGGDIDGDGNEDVILFHGFTPTGVLLRGDGTGQFPTTMPIPCIPGNQGCIGLIADIIPGGAKEIVLMSTPPAQPYAMSLTVLSWNPTTATWLLIPSISGLFPGYPLLIAGLADFNGDGLLDFVGSRLDLLPATVEFFVFPGIPGAPFFGPPVVLQRPVPNGYSWITWWALGDINGDGLADIVVRDGTPTPVSSIDLYTAFGHPSSVLTGWSPPTPIHYGIGATYTMIVRDFDGDGAGDLLNLFIDPTSSNSAAIPEFYRGLGDGLFLPPMSVGSVPYYHYYVVAADADGDGDKDLVCPATLTTTVYFNHARIGPGLAASNGVVPTLTNGVATPGNLGFSVDLANARPSVPCLLAASIAATPVPGQPIVPDLAPSSLLWPLGTLGPTVTDPSGNASFPIPLLPHPALAGAEVWAQWAVADPLNPTGYALSRGKKIVFW